MPEFLIIRQFILGANMISSMITSGSFFNRYAVKILVSAIGLIYIVSCSQTPKIYTMPPEHIEKIRSSLGTIGVTISSYSSKREIIKPAKGMTGGVARGFVVGATLPVVIGFASPVPGGTAIGVLIAPFTAVAGSMYGITQAASAEDIEKAEVSGDKAIASLKEMNLSQTFIDEVVKLGKEHTGLRFVSLSGKGPRDPNEVVRYDKPDTRGIDTILELRTEKAGLRGLYSFNPPSYAFIEVLARLIRTRDNEVIVSETIFCASEEERTYTEWSQNEGRLFVDEFISCIPELAEKIVDDFFLVYPISLR